MSLSIVYTGSLPQRRYPLCCLPPLSLVMPPPPQKKRAKKVVNLSREVDPFVWSQIALTGGVLILIVATTPRGRMQALSFVLCFSREADPFLRSQGWRLRSCTSSIALKRPPLSSPSALLFFSFQKGWCMNNMCLVQSFCADAQR